MRNPLLARFSVVLSLVVLLLVPLHTIRGVIDERAARRTAAIAEVASTWGAAQTLIGPVVVVPFHVERRESFVDPAVPGAPSRAGIVRERTRVRFALVLFYLLLVSLSEHVGFGVAYVAAASATTSLVSAYCAWVLVVKARALVMAGALAALYGYLFVLLRLEDYALPLGSVALFAVLGALMLATRRVDWWSVGEKPAASS